MHYNFARVHQTLRVSPAMAAGIADRLCGVSDIIDLLMDWEARQAKALEEERMAAWLGGAGPSALRLGKRR
jgi:hypothetical protein